MRLPRSLTYACFGLYYRLRIVAMRLVLGDEAIAVALYGSWFPHLILKIGRAKIGRHTRINRWLSLHECRGHFRNLEIGDDTYLGKHVLIDLTDKVTIGHRCCVGMNVQIITHVNFGDSRLRDRYPSDSQSVQIGDDSILNWGCIVLKGTDIAAGVILLPGTVASGTLKAGAAYVGNPMRMVPQIQPAPQESAAHA